MEIATGTGVGLALRGFLYLSGLGNTKGGAAALGLCEGAILHGIVRQPRRASHTTTDKSETDAYIALMLKLILDFLMTQSIAKVAIVSLWAGLGVVLVEVGERMLADASPAYQERRSRNHHRRRSSVYARKASTSRAASRIPLSDVCSTDSAFSPIVGPQVESPSTPSSHGTQDQVHSESSTVASVHDPGVPPLDMLTVASSSRKPLELSDILATPGTPAQPRGIDHDWQHASQTGGPTVRPSTPSNNDPVQSDSNSSSSVTPQGTPVRLLRDPFPIDPGAPATATPAPNLKMLPPMSGSPLDRPQVPISPLDALNPSIKVSLPDGADVPTVEATIDPAPVHGAPVVTVEVHPPTPPRDAPATQPSGSRAPPPPISYATISARAPVVTVNHIPSAPTPARPARPPSEAGTELESVLSINDRDGLLLHADRIRMQARAEEAARDDLEAQRRSAIRDGRSLDALRLKVRREEAFARAARLHRRAERRYHLAHNIVTKPHVIDIHGLKVREALRRVERALRDAIVDNASRLRVITGRGNHSKDNIPVLKNAVIEAMREYQIPVKINPANPGELWIVLSS